MSHLCSGGNDGSAREAVQRGEPDQGEDEENAERLRRKDRSPSEKDQHPTSIFNYI